MDAVSPPPEILVSDVRLDPGRLRALVEQWFGDMVKVVVDIQRHRIAVGGELHADAEALLLADGSRQADVWGANYYPGLGPDHCIEFTALVNIRPAQGNRSMEIQDQRVREAVQGIIHDFIGSGESL